MLEVENKFRKAAFFDSLGLGLFNPFLTLFLVKLGATTFQVGLLSSVVSFLNSIFQILSLPIFDVKYSKVKLYLIFSFLGGLLYIPIAHIQNIYVLIILIAFQSVFFSLSLVAWNEALIQLFPKWRRGREIGMLNTFSTIGSLISYIIGGIVIRTLGFVPYLFYASFFFTGILSNLMVIDIDLKQKYSSVRISFKDIIKDKSFMKLSIVVSIFYFAVGLGAPLFDLHLIRNIGADSVQLSIVSIVSLLVSYLFSEGVGKACDILGTRIVLLFSLPFIIFFPVLYAIGTTMIWIYIVTFICQLGWVAFNTSLFIHISDISDSSAPSKYFAIHYSFVNLFSTLGRFLAGYIAQQIGITQALILSSLARLAFSFLFLFFEERKGYYIKSPLSYLSVYRISSYIEGFVSVYSFVIKESGKTTIEKVLKNLTKMVSVKK